MGRGRMGALGVHASGEPASFPTDAKDVGSRFGHGGCQDAQATTAATAPASRPEGGVRPMVCNASGGTWAGGAVKAREARRREAWRLIA